MLRWFQTSLLGLATVVGTGCATAGTRPHDMPAARHEQAAEIAEREAAEHAARFDPGQAKLMGSRAGFTEVNPTAEHRQYAEKLRDEASEHRAAARGLREAEARSCAALPDGHGDLGPFFRREQVDGVAPLWASTGRVGVLRGASIALKPAEGLSAASVQLRLDCHLARNAALGFDLPDMGPCPLASRGVRAAAREDGARVVIEVTASDPSVADAILARASLLDPR